MNKLYENIFLYAIKISFLLYLLVFFGIGGYAPQYLNLLQYGLKIYVALLLIILYNPITYNKREFKEFDRNIVFTSGLFLFLSTTLFQNIENYFKKQANYLIDLGNNLI